MYIPGYWRNNTDGYWTIGMRTERGTIEKPLGVFGSGKEAQAAADRQSESK